MIHVTPLYQSLEWRPGLSERAQQSIEEVIGPDVFGTLIVQEDDYDTALHSDGESATLSLDNLQDVDEIRLPPVRRCLPAKMRRQSIS